MLSRAGLAVTLLAATVSVGALAANAQGAAPVRVVPGQILIRVPAGMSAQAVAALADGAGCDVVRRFDVSPLYYVLRLKGTPTRAAAAPRPTGLGPRSRDVAVADQGVPLTDDVRAAVAKLAETDGVLACPDYLLRAYQGAGQGSGVGIPPNDPYYAGNGFQRWHMDMIQMPQAWNIQYGGRAVRVGVVDSGIDPAHPDFKTPDGSGSRIASGRNFYDDDGDAATPIVVDDISDRSGHGTHVAGTVAATTNNSTGVAGVAGWDRGGVSVNLVIARTFGAAFSAPISGITEGIVWAAQQNIDVMNLSLGIDGIPETAAPGPMGQAIADAINAGVVVVAAAGNSNLNGNDRTQNAAFPADFPNVIKVSAVGPTRARASYSNYGGPVAIAAPGGDGAEGGPDAIWSTWPTYSVSIAPDARSYYSINGTSMASPHVAGAAALVVAAGITRSPNSAQTVKGILQSTAVPLAGDTPNNAGGNQFGAGLLNVYGAVSQAVGTYADPAPVLRAVSVPADRKATYYTTFSQVGAQVSISGVNKFLNPTDPANKPSVLTIELRTATEPSVVRAVYTYSTAPGGARDFDIAPLQPGEKAGDAIRTITLPPAGSAPIGLNEGGYNLVARLTYNGTTETASDYFEVRRRVQPAGRSLFAMPFRTRLADPANSERTVLGPSGFTLYRYDATGAANTDPTTAANGALDASGDYVAFRTTPGSPDNSAVAGFGAGSVGTPLTYLLSDPSTSIAPVGVGYWLDVADNRTLNPIGTTVTTEPVAIRLYAARGGGWNLIGAPFDFAVNWSGVLVQSSTNLGARQYTLAEAVDAGILSGVLVGYDQGQGYVYSVAPFGQLQPFNGYWVQAKQDCVLIVPPNPTAVTGATRAAKGAPSAATTVAATRKATGSLVPAIEGWRVRLSASAAGDVDGQNFFGQAKGASAQEDRLDIPKPPAGAGHAYLRFVSDQADGRKAAYAFDMKPVNGVKQEWTAAVSTDRANADVTLTWDGLGALPKRTRLVLTDTVTGRRIPMDSQSAYTFRAGEAGSTRSFKVSLQRAASGGPLQILNVTTSRVSGGRGTAGGGSGLNIRFTTSQDADVTASIRTLSGQLIADLGGATRAAAFANTGLVWNGRAQGGASVPTGPLVVELRARTPEGEVTTVKRPIQFLR